MYHIPYDCVKRPRLTAHYGTNSADTEADSRHTVWLPNHSFVVGYAGSTLKSGFTAAGAQFVPTSAEMLDLCDLVPTGYDKATYAGGSINLQLLDKDGMVVDGSNYYWYDDEDGQLWWTGDDEIVYRGDVTFKPGDAFWIYANNTQEGIRSSGTVATAPVEVTLRAGFKLICNPTPVAIPFNDDNEDGNFILPKGYDKATYSGGSINVQKLDKDGIVIDGSNFYWYDDDDGLLWWTGDDEIVEGEVLNPGEAIWVNANSTAEVISFPGVTLN